MIPRQITYCISVWGNCSVAMLSEIEKLHIKVGRVVHKVPYAECFGQWSDGLYQVASHLLRIRIQT